MSLKLVKHIAQRVKEKLINQSAKDKEGKAFLDCWGFGREKAHIE